MLKNNRIQNHFMILSLSLLVGSCALGYGRNYFVSGSGDDRRTGLSDTEAIRTLQKAAGLVDPGDTVWVADGAYGNLNLTRSGNETAWIVWKAKPGQAPEITYTGWNGITISANYLVLEGLTVTGNKDKVTLAQAETDYDKATPDGQYNGNGITIDGRKSAVKWHHIRIGNCTVRKNCGGGIAAMATDYITVEDCRIYENAWYSRYGASGLSFLESVNFDQAPGYHHIARRNQAWNNRGLVKWKEIGKLSDGNGIIIDYGIPVGYTGSVLVANNLCFNNGGSGIHSYFSANVDIVNNTTYGNGQVVDYASLFANASRNVRILNNIIYADPGKPVTSNSNNTGVIHDYNIYFGGLAPAAPGKNDRVIDAAFVNASKDPLVADFRLKAASPAINQGKDFPGLADDLLKAPRPFGGKIDIGAYEFGSSVVVIRAASGKPGVKPAYLGMGRLEDHFGLEGLPARIFDIRGGRISRGGLPTASSAAVYLVRSGSACEVCF